MRVVERAAFYAAWREKKIKGLFTAGSGGSGNAATRIEAFVQSKGAYAMGGYPDLDELFQQQAVERDRAKREALLHRIQQLMVERVMFAPVYEFRALMGVGPRVAAHAINVIPLYPFPALEEMQVQAK
jgi:peptide/nickel transport system substrate-binding protein